MSAVTAARAPARPRGRTALVELAVLEMRRYARHPLFLIGVALTALASITGPDARTSSFFHNIVSAAALGVLGLVATASLARSSRLLGRAAGVTPIPERVQTGALALACLLPFAAGLLWFAWAVWAYRTSPPPPNGFPFGPVDEGWKLSVLFGTGVVSALGGPLLGLAIGRWWPHRGVAPMAAVLLVAVVVVMQGLLEPLRRIRVVMPFTYWGGPFGIEGDPERMIIMTGSPQWWVAYLLCLCGLAVVAALWHDPGARTPRLRAVGVALLSGAVVTCLLAMFTGIDATLVNPLPGPPLS